MSSTTYSLLIGSLLLLLARVLRILADRRRRTLGEGDENPNRKRQRNSSSSEGEVGNSSSRASSERVERWSSGLLRDRRSFTHASTLPLKMKRERTRTLRGSPTSSIEPEHPSSYPIIPEISPYSSRSNSPCPSDISLQSCTTVHSTLSSNSSDDGGPVFDKGDIEQETGFLDPKGSVVSPLTCTKRGRCIIPHAPLLPTFPSRWLGRIFSRSTRPSALASDLKPTTASHEIYYELHGTGPKRAIMIMGLGNTSLAYAGQVRGIVPPVREPCSMETTTGVSEADADGEGEQHGNGSIPSISSISPDSLRSWGKDYTICVFDNRGIGSSDTPEGRLNWRTRCMAEDTLGLLRFLDWVRPGSRAGEVTLASATTNAEEEEHAELEDNAGLPKEKVHVVGTSLGGMIALELATMIPDEIESLTLCVTTPGSKWGFGNLPSWKSIHRMIQTFYETDTARKAEILFELCFPSSWLDGAHLPDVPVSSSAPPSPSSLSASSASSAGLSSSPPITNREHMTSLLRYRESVEKRPAPMSHWNQTFAALMHHVSADRLDALGQIPNVCVLTGKEDQLVDPSHSERIASSIPGAELIVWEDAGHAINIQYPERYNDLLRGMWSR